MIFALLFFKPVRSETSLAEESSSSMCTEDQSLSSATKTNIVIMYDSETSGLPKPPPYSIIPDPEKEIIPEILTDYTAFG